MLDESYDRDIRFAREQLGDQLLLAGRALDSICLAIARLRFPTSPKRVQPEGDRTVPSERCG